MSIFKAYDIRGTYPDQIDASNAFKIGAGMVKFLGAERLGLRGAALPADLLPRAAAEIRWASVDLSKAQVPRHGQLVACGTLY